MVSLGQNLKMRKKCEKQFYDHIRVVVCKKPRQKTPNSKKNESLLKMARIGQKDGLKPMQNGQFGSKIRTTRKMPKTIVKPH